MWQGKLPHIHPRLEPRRQQKQTAQFAMQEQSVDGWNMPKVPIQTQRQARLTQARGHIGAAKVKITFKHQRFERNLKQVKHRHLVFCLGVLIKVAIVARISCW